MSTTNISARNARQQFGPSGATVRLSGSGPMVVAAGREDLLDRLAHFRTILPAFAQELASARRQSAALGVENRKLLEEVRQLQRKRGDSGFPSRSTAKTPVETLRSGKRDRNRQ